MKETHPHGECYLPTVTRIYIRLQPRLVARKPAAAFWLLVATLTLSVELTVTHTWFVYFVPTAVTLFLIVGALIVISTGGWRGILSPPKPADDERPKLWVVMLVFGLCVLENVCLNQVFERLPQLEAYDADPVCSSSVMYRLAKETPGSAPASAAPRLSGGVCEVSWVQVTIDGQPIASHPYNWYLSYYSSIRDLRKGDFVVAQTAFGHLSAVLYLSTDFVDRIFSPRGTILPTADNPVPKFEEPFMWNLWVLLFLTPTGSSILWWLWASLRDLPYENGTV